MAEQATPSKAATSTKKRRVGFEPRPGHVVQAYVFALDPNAGTEQVLAAHCGAARFACNWALGQVKANLDQRRAERSYGISEQDLTPSASWSLYSLRRAWNAAKDAVAPWWSECSKEAFNTGLANAASALKNWSDSRKGARQGPKVGFARFKAKRTTTPSCRFTTGTLRLEDDRRHVTLPRVGTIRTHENTRKLHRRLAAGSARILSATVSHRQGRWQVALQCEVARAAKAPRQPEAVVGVDLGITTLAVTADSDGNTRRVANPRHLDRAQYQLRRANRRLSRRQGPTAWDPATGAVTRQEPSKRWVTAQRRLARVHHRVANLRRESLHQLTTSPGCRVRDGGGRGSARGGDG